MADKPKQERRTPQQILDRMVDALNEGGQGITPNQKELALKFLGQLEGYTAFDVLQAIALVGEVNLIAADSNDLAALKAAKQQALALLPQIAEKCDLRAGIALGFLLLHRAARPKPTSDGQTLN
jgi:hypothetical protein